VCRAEAPEVEQFARQYADQVRVIGLGTQDDGEYAVDFVESREVFSFPMYWDDTFESWVAFGVASQPAATLLSPSGEPLGAWRGMFPIDEVLELAADA
jgi:hypothetical protein